MSGMSAFIDVGWNEQLLELVVYTAKLIEGEPDFVAKCEVVYVILLSAFVVCTPNRDLQCSIRLMITILFLKGKSSERRCFKYCRDP